MTSEKARALMQEWIRSENLRKHCEAVSASMAYMAEKYGEDVDLWTAVGLLHDFDYEKYPSQEEGHPFKGVKYLRAQGVDEVICKAILSHAEYSGVPRETMMEKCLFAVDELSGFVTAVTLVRPSKNINEVEVNSVKKKLKTKEFAAKVSREDIRKGAEELGVEVDVLIADVIEGMKRKAETLGLAGAK